MNKPWTGRVEPANLDQRLEEKVAGTNLDSKLEQLVAATILEQKPEETIETPQEAPAIQCGIDLNSFYPGAD